MKDSIEEILERFDNRLRSLTLVKFTVYVAWYSMLVRSLGSFGLCFLLRGRGNMGVFREPNLLFFLIAVTIGPAVETAVGQWLPIEIVAKKAHSNCLKVIVSTLIFTLLHVNQGTIGVLVGITAGAALAYTYVVWREKRGLKEALLATWLVHVWLNIVPTIVGIAKLLLN